MRRAESRERPGGLNATRSLTRLGSPGERRTNYNTFRCWPTSTATAACGAVPVRFTKQRTYRLVRENDTHVTASAADVDGVELLGMAAQPLSGECDSSNAIETPVPGSRPPVSRTANTGPSPPAISMAVPTSESDTVVGGKPTANSAWESRS